MNRTSAPAVAVSSPDVLCAAADRVSDRRGPLAEPEDAVGSLERVLAAWQTSMNISPELAAAGEQRALHLLARVEATSQEPPAGWAA